MKIKSNFNPGPNYRAFDYRHMPAPKTCNCETTQNSNGPMNIIVFVGAIAAVGAVCYLIGQSTAPKITSEND